MVYLVKTQAALIHMGKCPRRQRHAFSSLSDELREITTYMTISINVLMGINQVTESGLLFIHLCKLATTNHKGVM